MKRILLADDEEDVLRVYSARLSSWGYEVILAGDGREALDIALEGFEVCRQIKANVETRGIPVIMISASPHHLNEEDSRKTGFDDFLSKPVVMKLLREKIEYYLRAAE